MIGARSLFPAFLLAATASSAAAQTMRDYDYTRAFRGERQLRGVIEFAAGRLIVRPGSPDRLYGLTLEYDADRFRPIGSYNAEAAEVRLGVESIRGGGIRVDRRSALPQTALVEFPPSVDLTLDVSVGAAEGSLELGGLRLTELDLKTGASRTTVSFSKPNKGSCRSASVASGAGELTVSDAGNSGCRFWRLDGGVGAVTLDLDGAWPADGRFTLNMALGGVTLLAPKDLGLRVRMNGFLAGFDASGFTKNGKIYTSAGYDRAARHVDVDVTSALGGVRVEWKE
jgi:hypothetical protein